MTEQNIKNLHFFDKDGYELNFDWNARGYWEGCIYLPKVSVGLYANTTIYILENINDNFVFPTGETGDKIVFEWDSLNKFVDEFFMFNFDENYIIKETSALEYTPNDGPDCNTLIINRFDKYEVSLDEFKNSSKALPVHIAFMANEKYDASTYNRTLVIKCGNKTISRIKFFSETVEEDERLQIWNSNLGYNITPDDTIIFKKSDIKEYKPDYILLNEKRKELMMEGNNIYPYIGSYKAIINAIKFFGYDNLNIIEYWKNVNPNDINFGKIYHSSKYSLTKKETLTIGTRTITLPNKDYKKINQLALVYSLNQPTGEVDEWELPIMKENFTYTIEEALIKLFALRKKLNKEFMPGTSRIIDIIGEANYFGLQGLTKLNAETHTELYKTNLNVNFEIEQGKYIHITDDRFFEKYIIEKKGYKGISSSTGHLTQFNVISDIADTRYSVIQGQRIFLSSIENPDNDTLCKLYNDYYKETFIEHTRFDDLDNTDDDFAPVSAKVVLTNKTFDSLTFENAGISFGYKLSSLVEIKDENGKSTGKYKFDKTIRDDCKEIDGVKCHITFENASSFGHTETIWTVRMSIDQTDEELKNIGIVKVYERKDFELTKKDEQIFIKLPYIGYYDVSLTVDGQEITKKKCIKVEPYQIEIKGFYYDARKLPDGLSYDMSKEDEMYKFIDDKMKEMTAWAVTERTSTDNEPDFSMPTYTVNGKLINRGPYFNDNMTDEWYLADNVSYDMSFLYPYVGYARYIRNGVDVKPYTWFLLGYEYTRISGKNNPVWTILNNTTGHQQTYEGKYLTCLLKEEGNYTISLTLKDTNNNEYEISRNIFVVNDTANHKIYRTFKKDYDYLMEQKQLEQSKTLQTFLS